MPSRQQQEDFKDIVWNNLTVMPALLSDAIAWIKNNLGPEDVFSTTELEEWAESEGYIKEETKD